MSSMLEDYRRRDAQDILINGINNISITFYKLSLNLLILIQYLSNL